MKYDIKYIRDYMNELDKKTGFYSKDIKIIISDKLLSMCAYNMMKWNYEYDENSILVNNKTVFSFVALNCGLTEKQFNDIISHEYCHAWADNGAKKSYKHKGKFINCCNEIKCSKHSVNPDKDISNKFCEYLASNVWKNKHK